MQMYSYRVEDETSNVGEITDAVIKASTESPHNLSTSWAEMYAMVKNVLVDTDNLVFTARDEADVIIGLILGTMSSPYLLQINRKVASELLWWVEKEHRNSPVGLRLFNAFESWASCADTITVGHYEGTEESETISRLYQRKGYTPMERNYIKEMV
jgi:GNAT superfamily N-acetyltransferase